MSHSHVVFYFSNPPQRAIEVLVITLSNKPRMTFSKEHQTGAHWFDALLRAKVALPLSLS
jgi:hypothetical protein